MTNGIGPDTPASLVEALGRHPLATRQDGDDDTGLFRWLLFALLLSGRASKEQAESTLRALSAATLDTPAALAARRGDAAAILAELGVGQPAQLGARLERIAAGLEAAGGSLEALARQAADLESLGGSLAALGPGLGGATLARFLTPLRERFPAAAELPLEPATLRAASHLGLVPEGSDTEAALPALRRLAAEAKPPVAFGDFEWALGQLGRRFCARRAGSRCPAHGCPLRGAGPPADSRSIS